MLRFGDVKTVKVHDLVPRRCKVVQKFSTGVLACVYLRQRPELGVGPDPGFLPRPNKNKGLESEFNLIPSPCLFTFKLTLFTYL
jgi:hypothetical protein